MNLRAKIATTLTSMLLALGVMGFAVYAAATQTLVVNNTVNFVSRHVLANIVGIVTGAKENVALDLDYSETVDSASEENYLLARPWNIGNMQFAEETGEIVISITVTNLSRERPLTFQLTTKDASIWNGEGLGDDANNNITRDVTYSNNNETNPATNQTYQSGKVLIEQEKQVVILITLQITDTGRSVNDFDNSFDLTLENVGEQNEQPQQPEEPVPSFEFDSEQKSIVIPSNKTIDYSNIPDLTNLAETALFGLYTDPTFEHKISLPYTPSENQTLYAKVQNVSENFKFTKVLDGYMIDYDQYADRIVGKLEIPEMVNGIPVTAVHPSAFNYHSELEEIVFPDSIRNISATAFDGTKWMDNAVPNENGLIYIGNIALKFVGSVKNNTVILQENTTAISEYLFRSNRQLKNIVLPPNLTTIGNYAFESSGLQTLHIPASVEEIGAAAFSDTPLVNLSIAPLSSLYKIDGGAFYNTPWNLTLDSQPGMHYLGNVAYRYVGTINGSVSLNASTTGFAYELFFGQTGLTSIHLPTELKYLGGASFYQTGLTSIDMLQTKLHTIDSNVFYGTALTSVTIPNTVRNINGRAFPSTLENVVFENHSEMREMGGHFDLTNLNSVDLGNNSKVKIIKESAFENASLLTHFDFGENSVLDSIEHLAFRNAGIGTLDFPSTLIDVSPNAFLGTPFEASFVDGVNYVGKVAYQWKGALSGAVSLRNDTISIAANLFSGKSGLTGIVLPDSVQKIGGSAFKSTGLTNIVIPNQVKIIGDSAFYSSKLTNVQFAPNSSLSIIGNNAFAYSKLTSLVIPNSVIQIKNNAFNIFTLASVTFEANSALQTIENSAFNNGIYTEITIPKSVTKLGNSSFSSSLRHLRFEDESSLSAFPAQVFDLYSLISIDFGNHSNLQMIEDGAFNGASQLTSIDFGENSRLHTIGYGAFSGGFYTSVLVPASVTSLMGGAFNSPVLESVVFEDGSQLAQLDPGVFGTNSLTTVHLGNNSNLAIIGDGAFAGAFQLSSFEFGENSKVESIGSGAFEGCGLTSVQIPSSVKHIQPSAFYGCSSLSNVTLQEGLLSIGAGAFASSPLVQLILPEGLLSIGSGAFASALLDELMIPSSVLGVDEGETGFLNSNHDTVLFINSEWVLMSLQLSIVPYVLGMQTPTIYINAELLWAMPQDFIETFIEVDSDVSGYSKFVF